MPKEWVTTKDKSYQEDIENLLRTDPEFAVQEIILFLLRQKSENRSKWFTQTISIDHPEKVPERPVYYPWDLYVDYEDPLKEQDEEIGLTATCTYTVKDDDGRAISVVTIHVDAQGNYSKVESPVEDGVEPVDQIPPVIAEQESASETHASIEVRLSYLVAELKKLPLEDRQRLAQILLED